jgi:hypothetical protein
MYTNIMVPLIFVPSAHMKHCINTLYSVLHEEALLGIVDIFWLGVFEENFNLDHQRIVLCFAIATYIYNKRPRDHIAHLGHIG